MKKPIIFLVLILCLASCTSTVDSDISPTTSQSDEECTVETINSFIESANAVENRLYHLSQQAVMKISMGEDLWPIVEDMFSVESDADQISAPSCILKTKAALTSYVETFIQVYAGLYLESTGARTDLPPSTSYNFDLAASKYDYYQMKMDELRNLLIEKCSDK
jgi:hypothetical protein